MEGRLFFEFLQVAVGNRKSLSVAIDDSDWGRLFDFCKKQALIGVGFSAVEKLHTLGIVCPANLRMQWMALALQIEKKNILLNEQCRKLTEQYGHDGLSTCILKGQGNCLNYPETLNNRRQCGDIDIWATPMNGRQQGQHETTLCPQANGDEWSDTAKLMSTNEISDERIISRNGQQLSKNNSGSQADGGIAIAVQTGKNDVEYVEYHGRKAVIEYVRMQHRLAGNDEKPVIRYHHIEAPKMEGTEVEVHFRVGFLNSPLRNWRMQRWFDEHADICMKNKTQMGFAVPTSSVNVVYQMCHLFSHYFDEGLGLRQLMDYYFALRVWHNDVMECKDLQSQGMWSDGLGTPVMSDSEVMAVLRSFGMGKFAAAVMYVLQEVFVGGNENDNENEKCPQMNTDGHVCPQADGEWSDTAKLMSTNKISNERIITRNGQQLSKKYYAPWLICEPNEKEGKKLLAEIMQGGNFGQYDTRDAALKKGGMMKHGVWKLKRVMRLVRSYPEEALWEPVFRIWHLAWRGING